MPEEVDASSGVFVTARGLISGDGTPEKPIVGLGTALEGKPSRVFLSDGTYEMEHFNPTSSVSIEGGWAPTGTTWTKACSTNRQVTLLFSDYVGVRIGPTPVALSLTDVVVAQTALPNGDDKVGGSFAIWVEGDASLHLLRSDVTSRKGDSPAPPQQPTGAGNPVCTKPISNGDGAPGAVATEGSAAPAGHLTQAGYSPGDATAGTDGNPGANGVGAGAPPTTNCGESSGQCNSGSHCSLTVGSPRVGSPGAPGCGGVGGRGGPPGASGEASVALFLVGPAASAVIESSTLHCEGGGDGAEGAPGGAGSAGAPGTPGGDSQCPKPNEATVATHQSDGTCVCEPTVFITLPGGLAGGNGGAGSPGGKGGSGSGGPCYAIAIVGGTQAQVQLQGATVLDAGPGGAAGPGALAGIGTPLYVSP